MYLVYYETFPEGIEGAWTYETKDKIIAAVALGGVLNLGGGSFKAAASGIRATGGKLVGLAIVKKAGTKMTIRQAITNAAKSGRSAASDRLALEYGGVKALEKLTVERIARRKFGGSVVGVDGVQNAVDKEMGRVILENVDDAGMIRKIFGKADDMEKLAGSKKSGLADFNLMIRSGKPIEKDTVERFVAANKIRKPGEVIPALNDDELKALTNEVDELAKMHGKGNLITGEAEEAIMKSITKELEKSGLLYKKLKKSYLAVVRDEKDEKGMIAAMKKATDKKAIRIEQMAVYNKKIDKHAVDIYEDIMKTAKVPGVAGTGDKSKFAAYFEKVWDDVDNTGSLGTKEIMKGLGTRAETLARGVPFGKTWKFDTQKKVMAAAIVASHIAMKTDAEFQKYETCGSGTMCLHFPSFFGDDNNKAYGLGDDVKSTYKGLVMTKYPGDKTDRFHIMSPCKTDLLVVAHDDDGFCKCEELYVADKVYYKLQKAKCVLDGTMWTCPINADGTCPGTYTFEGKEYKIKRMDDFRDKGIEFTCDADEDQDECISKFMHEDPCVDDKYNDGCLNDEFRNCYDVHGSKGAYYCDNPSGADCDVNGHCIGVGSLMLTHPIVPLSVHQDTFAIPINLKEHVTVDKSDEPITVCTNSWASNIFGSTNTDYFRPCVSVAYDVVSMRRYSKDGFGVNYCAENKADFKDKLEKACFWGGIVGSVAVSAFSGGVTGTVIVPVAIGSVSVGCEKILNMKSRWPRDQH